MTEKHRTGIVVFMIAIMVVSLGGCRSISRPSAKVSDIDILQGMWVGTELGNNGGQ